MAYRSVEDRRAYSRTYYLAHRERIIAASRAWAIEHPDRHRELQRGYARNYHAVHRDEMNRKARAYDAAHPEKTRFANHVQRLRRYGLRPLEYEDMVASQGGVCALCRKAETHRGRNGEVTRLAVDHDHATGSVRALLCHSCNTGVGLFLDDPALLRAAADYLDSFTG